MMVPAPGLFSIMTVAARSMAISCASVRAITSVPPPGANGTTIFTILSGYPAKARFTESAAGNNAASANRRDAVFILIVRSKSMGDRLRLEFFGNAPADHAFSQSAMRGATNGYDAIRACWRWTRGVAID